MISVSVLILVILFCLVLAQFGQELPASHAVLWWIIFAFLFLAAAKPTLLRPVADFLGVLFISNMIFAGLIMLLLIYIIFLARLAHQSRQKLEAMVSHLALAQSSFNKTASKNGGPSQKKKVLVFFPVYNEAENLPEIFRQVELLKNHQEHAIEFCFIDDGSQDNSGDLLRTFCPNQAVYHSVNVRVSGVLRTAIALAYQGQFDFLVQCDSDGQHPVAAIPKLIQAAETGQIDLLIGSRFVADSKGSKSTTTFRMFGIGFLRTIIHILWPRIRVNDPTSGFRVYSLRAARILKMRLPEQYPEPESIGILSSHGCTIQEFPVEMQPRLHGKSSISFLGSFAYATRVTSALLGLRMRTWLRPMQRLS